MLLLLNSSGFYTKQIKQVFNLNKQCPLSIQRLKNIAEIKKTLNNNLGANILSTGGAIPLFLNKDSNFFQAGKFSRKSEMNLDYILLEKPQTGNPWPYSFEEIKVAIEVCRKTNSIVLENEDYILFENNESNECISFHLNK